MINLSIAIHRQLFL